MGFFLIFSQGLIGFVDISITITMMKT